MRRKGSFSGIFPTSPRLTAAAKASPTPSQSPSRLSLSLPLPLSPAQTPPDSLMSPTLSEASEHDGNAALDRAVASVLMSPRPSGSHIAISSRKTSLMDCEYMQGYMVIHAKKSKKKLFTLNRSYFVVADTSKSVLEVFANESKVERVYLFSLAGANVDFETDEINHAVRAKCFCLNVQSWRKRGVDYLRPQGFVFYQESQAQMMVWVKCIHVAIRKANTAKDPDTLLQFSETSTVGCDESDVTECERVPGGDRETEPYESERDTLTYSGEEEARHPRTTEVESVPVVVNLSAPRSPRRTRGQSRRRAAVDPVEPTEQSVSSPPETAKACHFSRFNTILATMKSTGLHHNHCSAEGGKAANVENPNLMAGHPSKSTSPFTPGLMSSLHMPRGKSSSSRQVVGVASPSSAGKRLSDPFQSRKKDDPFFSGFPPFFSPRGPRSASKQASPSAPDAAAMPATPAACSEKSTADPDISELSRAEQPTPERRISRVLARIVFLLVSFVGGVLRLSVFLPIASAGLFVSWNEAQAAEFGSAAIAACWVFAVSYVQASLGLCSIVAIVYGWSYADFKTSERNRRRRIAERLLQEENENFAHVQFPNWVVRPDSDRVDWLNKVLATGWPFMKIAIRNSILGYLNPLLASSLPAFMSSLSLVQVDLGTKVPVITGVKYVSATTKTEEVTLDIDVRIMSDESLVAELRMASRLGAAAVVSLRDLFLAGTLRITLNPLSTYWPCFSAISLSFTERPVVDFSLTAAKINISNVPFASEWLQTYLHDLLLDYFVWPKVLQVPLWEDPARGE